MPLFCASWPWSRARVPLIAAGVAEAEPHLLQLDGAGVGLLLDLGRIERVERLAVGAGLHQARLARRVARIVRRSSTAGGDGGLALRARQHHHADHQGHQRQERKQAATSRPPPPRPAQRQRERSQTSRTAPRPPGQRVTMSAARRTSRVRIGDREATGPTARISGRSGTSSPTQAQAAGVELEPRAQPREYRELVGHALVHVADAELAAAHRHHRRAPPGDHRHRARRRAAAARCRSRRARRTP